MVVRTASLALLVAAIASGDARSQEQNDRTFIGAEAAIQQWTEPKDKEQTAEQEAIDPLRQAIEAFGDEVHTMEPQAAAQSWLGLYDQWLGQEKTSDFDQFGGFSGLDSSVSMSLQELVEAIPGPDAWPTLSELVQQREEPEEGAAGLSERALRLLVAYLNRDQQVFESQVEASVNVVQAIEPYYVANILESVQPLTDLFIEEDAKSLEDFEQTIQDAASSMDTYEFEVPDLVTLYGQEKAEELLRQIVVLPVNRFEFSEGEATLRLARKTATEKVDELKRPLWELVNSIDEDSVALYEAIQNRLQEAGEDKGGAAPLIEQMRQLGVFEQRAGGWADQYSQDDYQVQKAQVYYLAGLITLGRIDDAEKLVETGFSGVDYAGDPRVIDLPYGLMETLQAHGAVPQLFDFAAAMVEKPVGQAIWPTYIELGAHLERSDEVLAKLEAAFENADGPMRDLLAEQLVSALLAADRIDEGVAAIRKQIEALTDQAGAGERAELLGLHLQLAWIADLIGDDAMANESIDAAVEMYDKEKGKLKQQGSHLHYARSRLVSRLNEAGRIVDAERLQIEKIRDQINGIDRDSFLYSRNPYSEIAESMVDLTAIYAEAERWGDILTLLRASPYWGEADLAALRSETGEIREQALGYYAALALARTGESEEAASILEAMLYEDSDEDALYGLWVEVKGQDGVVLLDELFKRDQFEERPLIWKAVLQLQAGEVDTAEATIRRAIAIDPSDGEQGPGDRIRAYAVLGDVLAAKGDEEGAATMQGVVEAIRTAERADAFYRADLLSRGITMYREALTHFSDAYCIQSRLAVQLTRMGKFDEAIEHYEKAYELMPDSFGRVESHCFGCEGVFGDERAQPIAERVFTRMLLARPSKPQLHYLLGYLKDSRGEDVEAMTHFRKAVELDPMYLNAWKQIESMRHSMFVPQKQRDEATIAIFKLDPLGRHSSPDLDTVGDLAAAWRAAESVQSLRVAEVDKMMPLPASTEKLEEISQLQQDPYEFYDPWGHTRELPTPAGVVAQHGVVGVASALIEMSRYE